ncbi:hypothetical protein H4R18_004617 [Coemansia javaensis]|uniref:F-box domain-containing protein n=1 Tax=Coemansia javaensis TaxID=2761396 RepID=A0A9W8HB43_9FUNG|nr:hypothetical protein H4R18_004617 [Coemansia javaensis]
MDAAAVPEDVWIQVLARLDPQSLAAAGRVCRQWRAIVSSDHSWQRALVLRYGRRPFQRLQPRRMPAAQAGGPGWLAGGRAAPASWRSDYVGRLGLHRQWAGGSGGRQRRRIEFSPRVGAVDGLVVSEQHGWALAASLACAAAVRCRPQSGKVFARDDDVADVIFALGDGPGEASALGPRIDRIAWGLGDGRSAVTHLTRGGELRARAVAELRLPAPVTAVAGAFDALAQDHHEWAAAAGLGSGAAADELVASACAAGSVLVWSAATGRTRRLLHGRGGVELTHVTWTGAGRFVAAAAEAEGVLFVWDLAAAADRPVGSAFDRAHWLRPDDAEFAGGRQPPAAVFPVPAGAAAGRLVLLAGDPLGASFVVATEAGGAARLSVAGEAMAAFDLGPAAATLTAAAWMLDATRRPQSDQARDQALDPDRGLDPGLDGAPPRRPDATRLLLVGDAAGSVWLFDGDDGGRSVAALRQWPRLHRRAVAALTANAAVAVSAGRDGQLLVLDPVSGRTLCADRSARRPASSAETWFWSVHPRLRGAQAAAEAALAGGLAARSAALWDAQTADGSDALDRGAGGDDMAALFGAARRAGGGRRFPSMVAEVRAGYAWVVAAGGMRVHACFAGMPARARRAQRADRPAARAAQQLGRLVQEGVAEARAESQLARERRLRDHAAREHIDREYGGQLGLSPDEQMAYALWLSAGGAADELSAADGLSAAGGLSAADGLSEAEQLEYALMLSKQ